MGIAALLSAYRRLKGGFPYPLAPGSLGPVTFPGTPLRGLVEIALGADLTAAPVTWSWTDITEYVRHDLGVSTTVGRANEATKVTPSRAVLKLSNTDGRFSRRNPTGPYFGRLSRNTPIRMSVDAGPGMQYRYHGFVNDWPTRWSDESGSDATVTIVCGGLLRRLGQGDDLRSPLFRTMAGVAPGDYRPYVYWPCEDGTNAVQFASGLPGGAAATLAGTVTKAALSTLVGSKPLPSFALDAKMTMQVAAYTATSQWAIQLCVNVPSEPSGNHVLLNIATPGGAVARWTFGFEQGAPDAWYLRGYNPADVEVTNGGTGVVSGAILTDADFYGDWFMLTVATHQDGANINGWIKGRRHDGLAIEPASLVPVAGTHGGVAGNLVYTSPIASTGCGHFALYTDADFDISYSGSADDINASAMDGYAGELAHTRMVRLCREEQVTFSTAATTSAALGPQPTGTLLDVLRDCESADGGVLYEHEWGLAYQALSQRYNQSIALSLDFDAAHIAETPAPADDDQRYRNQWTAARKDGSSHTYRDPDYSATTGLYADTVTINVQTDAQLPDQASWRVHRDIVAEDRWPRIPLNFARSPGPIGTWTTTPFGARINVANPPAQMAPDTIDAIIEGYSERWDTVSWTASLNTSPASPYTVGVYDDTDVGRYDSGTSTLTSDITSTATSFSVSTTATGDLWTTDTAEMPLSILIGGERMSVTAVSGASSPQTFTVTRASNGVVKAHSAGAQVHVYNAARFAL